MDRKEKKLIHQYKNNGYNIVLDVNSGSVHVVDDVVYDVIACMVENHLENADKETVLDRLKKEFADKAEEWDELVDEIYELKKDGMLFAEDIYEKSIDAFRNRETVVKALCLHIAHDCNLKCRYCFAEEGEYHGRRALMSYEVGKKALDFLVANSGSRVNLEVDFFGGEPLMNWQVVKDLVAYGRSLEEPNNKRFRFTLTTNGVLLSDDIIDFANREMANIVLSVDGRKEIHDKMRPLAGGQGSYDLVIPKFKKVAESRNQTNYYVRGTFTHFNKDFAADVCHLADLGFEQISVEPVVAPDGEDYALVPEDIPELLSEYDKLAVEMVRRHKEGKGFNFFHFMIDLKGGPCVYKRLSGCGSGTEYLASKEKCRNCFAKFYCSGGCAANSYNFHGNINDAYDLGCELQRKRVECAIMIKAALAEETRA